MSARGSSVTVGFVAMAVGTYMTVSGLRRYRRILTLANRLCSAATCASCKTYAAFSLRACGSPQGAPEGSQRFAPQWLRVSCDKCAHEWTIVPFTMVLVA